MIDEKKTLRELLSDPLIEKIAPDAIRNMDLTKDEKWEKSLEQLKKDCFGGDLTAGFETLYRAAKSGKWYYPLYTEAECEEDAGRKGVNLVWLPSLTADAGRRPYILLVPGGGFVNVWNLTEGWPVAAQFNRLGYNVFVLTYQVAVDDHLLEREMGDFARAIAFIRDNADTFNVDWKRYITCGFSAGGYLVCLWNVPEKGFAFHGLPKPQAVFPVYPAVSWKLNLQDGEEEDHEDDDFDLALFGCDIETAIHSPFEIPDHTECFPPCAIFLTKTDELVNPEHSYLLQQALQRHGISCRLEAGPSGGHGFADGTGMCMAGWIERAVRWYEELSGTLPAEKQNTNMGNIGKYRQYFTKDYLMGPNSFRLLDELIRRKPSDVQFHRTLDLGCGFALTSLFIANETDADYVYAYDLWISASDNYLRIRDNHLDDRIIPIHGDAMDMPFAHDYFDTIVSVDAYHYFGCREGIFAEKILPFVKKGGYVMIVVPGLKEQPRGDLKQLFETWAEGDDAQLFKTAAWWKELLKNECSGKCDITVNEAECFDIAWQEWFETGHEFGVRDREYLQKGLDRILNFVLIYVRKN